MAVLSDKGVHCSVSDCRQRDFLPFSCDQCGQLFCLNHFRYEAHSCARAAGKDNRVLVCPLCHKGVRLVAGEDPNVTWERHVSTECAAPSGGAPPKKDRCPVPGCKEQLTTINRFDCGRCGRRVCLKHRFEDAHGCSAAASASRGSRPAAASTIAAAMANAQGAVASATAHASGAAAGARSAMAAAAAGGRGQGWDCPRCTLHNSASARECSACGAPAPSSGPAASGGWSCGRCTLENSLQAPECQACGAPRPAGAAPGGDSNCTMS